MDPGSKVTYNGVQIGRVATFPRCEQDGKPAAKFTLDVYPKYLRLIPANVDAKIVATTVFGEKYVSFTSPKNPSPQRISSQNVIDARSVTTEINTLFQTITSIAEKVDPVKVNLTLSAAAQALNGLGDKFGQSIVNANAFLDDVNPRMPHDPPRHPAVGDAGRHLRRRRRRICSTSSTMRRPRRTRSTSRKRSWIKHCWRRPASATPAPTSSTAAGRIWPAGPPIWCPSAQLLDTYSPELYCTIRNLHDGEPKVAAFAGGFNGYSLRTETEIFSRAGTALSLPGSRPHVAHSPAWARADWPDWSVERPTRMSTRRTCHG